MSLKREYDAVLMGLSKPRRDARELLKNPPDATPIEADDYVILLLSGAAAQRVEEFNGGNRTVPTSTSLFMGFSECG